MKNRLIRGILVGLAAFLAVFSLHHLHIFHSLEWKSWDLRLRLFSNPSPAGKDIVLFLIDQDSLDVYEKEQGLSWPWPRQIYSAIIHYCKKGGAKAVIIDLIFSEVSGWGVEDDQNFAAAVAEAGNVFLPVFLSRSEKETEEVPPLLLLERFSLGKKNAPPKALFPMKSITTPLEGLLRSVQGVGNVNLSPDKDGIYRRLPLFFAYKSLILPCLPLAVADFIEKELKIGTIPLDESGQMIIRFYGPSGTYRSYSIAAIINSFALLEEGKIPQIPPEEFVGKIVLVGASAPGLYDLRPSPFSAVYPGVEIQATAIDNILQGDFVRLPPEIVFIILLGIFSLLTGIGITQLRSIWKTVLFFLLCIALPAIASYVAFLSGYWLELVASEFAVLLSFMGASLLNYSFEGRQRRFIKSVFRYYLSHHVIERMMADPSLLRLGGEKREISSFFSDVAGFTSIAEHLSPEDLVNLLNAYLSEMTEIILSFGGTLDKYEGDAIIAFWNAPLEQPDHALKACRAALKCQKRLEELRPDFGRRFGHELFMRIGVNSGPAVVGNMGSGERFDYTAIGDTVNLASRLEGACKQYDIPILIGEGTFERVKGTLVSREVDLIRVVGKKKPERVFEIIGEKGEVSSSEIEKIENYHYALQVYRKQEWGEAQRLFKKIENDILAQMYVARCQSLKKFPPHERWTGVYDLKEK